MQFVKSVAPLALAALAGCSSLTPRERTTLEFVGTAVLMGSIAACESGHDAQRRDFATPGRAGRP